MALKTFLPSVLVNLEPQCVCLVLKLKFPPAMNLLAKKLKKRLYCDNMFWWTIKLYTDDITKAPVQSSTTTLACR